jgi:hypothetical protein
METNEPLEPDQPQAGISHQPEGQTEGNTNAAPQVEAAASVDPSTTNNQPSTPTDMEVHHHAHDPAAPHHKKNWKSYFWEFLMLFLAVFCGFLAEYQLEHYIEKQRAKEFAVSLHRDLVSDTVALNGINMLIQNSISDIDSLTSMLDGGGDLKANTFNMYKYSVNAFGFPQYQANQSTLQQLLNSGSLRYFKNAKLVDSIKFYNLSLQRNADFSASSYLFNLEFRKVQIQLLKIDLITHAMYTSNTSNAAGLNTGRNYNLAVFTNQPLLSYDPQKMKEYSNWCAFKNFYLINTLRRYMLQKSTAISVIALLKESYDVQ